MSIECRRECTAGDVMLMDTVLLRRRTVESELRKEVHPSPGSCRGEAG